jgi:hypothetical protein
MRTAACLVLTILVACGSTPPPAAPAPAPAPAAESVRAEPEPLDETAPTVRMLVPGTSPRQLLRYAFTASSTEYMQFDMRLGIETTFDDPTLGQTANKVETPTIRMTIQSSVSELLPGGDARVVYEVVGFELLQDVQVPAAQRAALESSLAQVAGMTGSSRLSARGVPSELKFELPNATPQLQQMMDSLRDAMRQMYIPLPKDPVGKGAKWEATARYRVSNMIFDSKIIYLMTERSAGSLEVKIETALSAQPQSFPLAHGMTGTIKSSAGVGTGTLSQPLTRLVGTGTNNITSDTQFSVDDGSKTLHATMHMTATVAVRPGKPPQKN